MGLVRQIEVKPCVCGHGVDRHGIDYGMCKATGCSCNEYRLDFSRRLKQ